MFIIDLKSIADNSATGMRFPGLIIVPNDVSALCVTSGHRSAPFRAPGNYIEMRYEIVEGGQNRSGGWLDNSSVGFCAGELSYRIHRFPKRQHDKFDRVAPRMAKQVRSPMSFDIA